MNSKEYLGEMFGLEGKIALISGGAGVIGTVMSKALLQAGATVVIWSRSQQSVSEAVQTIIDATGKTDRIKGMQVDAGDESAVQKGLANLEKNIGSPDILINAVGGNIGKADFVDTDIDTFKKVLDMNLVAGLVVPTKTFASYWIEKGIFLSS